MSHTMIKEVFIILGTMVLSLILFSLIFTSIGQQFLWNAIEPGMENHWKQCTMDNGINRSLSYYNMFDEIE